MERSTAYFYELLSNEAQLILCIMNYALVKTACDIYQGRCLP